MASTHTTPASHRGPRRPRSNGKLVAGIVIVAVLIAGGTVATIAAMRSGQAGATTSQVPVAGSTSPEPTASPTPTSARPTPTDPAAADAAACRSTVTAAEAAVAAARTGAGHWSIHTQARTDFLAHKITLTQTNDNFKKTKLLGPADQKAFADALAAYERVATGCDGLSSASDSAAKTCATKAAELRTTVAAGQAVMKDWASHLNNMALHAEHEMSATRARTEWIAAWKAAPANLNAFSAADSASTKAPSCPAG
ncbi:hypothetical protein BH11ACT1_BH11ACT1_10690 [soil metagenome]